MGGQSSVAVLLLLLLRAVVLRAECSALLPRGEVACYLEGGQEVPHLDPCLCSLLVVGGTTLQGGLALSSDLNFDELDTMKAKNTNLRTIVSLGGTSVKAESFEQIVASTASISNFTEQIVDFLRVHKMDGVEVDWQWPGQNGGSRDRKGLTLLMKSLRAALDDLAEDHKIQKRETEKQTPNSELSSTAAPVTSPTVVDESTEPFADSETLPKAVVATGNDEMKSSVATGHAPAPDTLSTGFDLKNLIGDFLSYAMGTPHTDEEAQLGATEDETDTSEVRSNRKSTVAEEDTGSFPTTPLASSFPVKGSTIVPNDATLISSTTPSSAFSSSLFIRVSEDEEGVSRDTDDPVEDGVGNLGNVRRGTVRFIDHYSAASYNPLSASEDTSKASTGWTWPLEDRQAAGERRGLLLLRLSNRPEYLAKGYDLKRLASLADLFSLGTHNLTAPHRSPTLTAHHARLMGVADVENADSLVDLVSGLGVPLDRLLLGVSPRGMRFTLADPSLNTPRSPTEGSPSPITYSEVCRLTSEGNWTVERDEDLTAPYVFSNSTWVAYEDATSLKIKTKYARLRGLGGVALHHVSEDDGSSSCGGETFPLLRAVWGSYTELVRTPRKAVLESLVEDLEAAESRGSLSYASAPASISASASNSRRFSTSPFKIVRIVDRQGEIRALRSNEETHFSCTRQGYYRHPSDCSQFYRCVKFDQYIDDFTVFEYDCPPGLVFDDRWEVCAWPSAAPPCDGSSEIFPIPSQKNVCPGEGFFSDPENCRWFFACKDYYGNGTYMQYEFRCPFGLAYDEENGICNWSWLVDSCGDAGVERQKYQGDVSNIQPVPVSQVAGGLFGSRGRGKKLLGDSSRYGEHGGDSSDEKCEGCGDSPQLTLGGSGVYDPQRGIVVKPNLLSGGSSSSGYSSPSSRPPSNLIRNKIKIGSANRGKLSNSENAQVLPARTSGQQTNVLGSNTYRPGSRSGSGSKARDFSSSRPRTQSTGQAASSSRNRLQENKRRQNTGKVNSLTSNYGASSGTVESDEDFSNSGGYRFPEPVFESTSFGSRIPERQRTGGLTSKDVGSGLPSAPSSIYGVPQVTYVSSAQPSRGAGGSSNTAAQAVQSSRDGSSDENSRQSGYSYPEPEVNLDSKSVNGRYFSNSQQAPEAYDQENIGIDFVDRENENEKYDKSMYGDNVQSARRTSASQRDGNSYSVAKPSSIFIKINSEDDRSYNNAKKNNFVTIDSSSSQEGYAYEEPERNFDPFSRPSQDDSDERISTTNIHSSSSASRGSQISSTYGVPRPTTTYTQPAPSYTSPRPASRLTQPAPSYTSPRPASRFTQPAPSYTSPRPASRLTQPAPSYTSPRPASRLTQPTPSYTSPRPASRLTQPAPSYTSPRPASRFTQPAPSYTTPRSTTRYTPPALSYSTPRATTEYSLPSPGSATPRPAIKQQPTTQYKPTTAPPLISRQSSRTPEYSYDAPQIGFNPFQAPTTSESRGTFADTSSSGEYDSFSGIQAKKTSDASSTLHFTVPSAGRQPVAYDASKQIVSPSSGSSAKGSENSFQSKTDETNYYSVPSGRSFNPFKAPSKDESSPIKTYSSGSSQESDSSRSNSKSSQAFKSEQSHFSSAKSYSSSSTKSSSSGSTSNSNSAGIISHFGPISSQAQYSTNNDFASGSASKYSEDNQSTGRLSSSKVKLSQEQERPESDGYAYQAPSKTFNPFSAPSATLKKSSENQKSRVVSHFGPVSSSKQASQYGENSQVQAAGNFKSKNVGGGGQFSSTFDGISGKASGYSRAGGSEQSKQGAVSHFTVTSATRGSQNNAGSSQTYNGEKIDKKLISASNDESTEVLRAGYKYDSPLTAFDPFAGSSSKTQGRNQDQFSDDDSKESNRKSFSHFKLPQSSTSIRNNERLEYSQTRTSDERSSEITESRYQNTAPSIAFNPFTSPSSGGRATSKSENYGVDQSEENVKSTAFAHFGIQQQSSTRDSERKSNDKVSYVNQNDSPEESSGNRYEYEAPDRQFNPFEAPSGSGDNNRNSENQDRGSAKKSSVTAQSHFRSQGFSSSRGDSSNVRHFGSISTGKSQPRQYGADGSDESVSGVRVDDGGYFGVSQTSTNSGATSQSGKNYGGSGGSNINVGSAAASHFGLGSFTGVTSSRKQTSYNNADDQSEESDTKQGYNYAAPSRTFNPFSSSSRSKSGSQGDGDSRGSYNSGSSFSEANSRDSSSSFLSGSSRAQSSGRATGKKIVGPSTYSESTSAKQSTASFGRSSSSSYNSKATSSGTAGAGAAHFGISTAGKQSVSSGYSSSASKTSTKESSSPSGNFQAEARQEEKAASGYDSRTNANNGAGSSHFGLSNTEKHSGSTKASGSATNQSQKSQSYSKGISQFGSQGKFSSDDGNSDEEIGSNFFSIGHNIKNKESASGYNKASDDSNEKRINRISAGASSTFAGENSGNRYEDRSGSQSLQGSQKQQNSGRYDSRIRTGSTSGSKSGSFGSSNAQGRQYSSTSGSRPLSVGTTESASGRAVGHFGSPKPSKGKYGSVSDSTPLQKSKTTGSFTDIPTRHFGSPKSSNEKYGSASDSTSLKAGKTASSSTNAATGHFGSPKSSNGKYGSASGGTPLQAGTTPNTSPYGKSFANPQSLGVRVPVNDGPSLVAKLGGGSAKKYKTGFQKFGPGGFRDFEDTLGPEVCERAGLFRHPDSCDKFYECYWDRWIEKFTLHVFDCPVTIVYDSGITACNWPFNGPPCTDERHA